MAKGTLCAVATGVKKLKIVVVVVGKKNPKLRSKRLTKSYNVGLNRKSPKNGGISVSADISLRIP